MDNSLIMSLRYLKYNTHVGKTNFKGSMSQNLDIRLGYCFVLCRRWQFIKKLKKSPIFCYKKKKGPKY